MSRAAGILFILFILSKSSSFSTRAFTVDHSGGMR